MMTTTVPTGRRARRLAARQIAALAAPAKPTPTWQGELEEKRIFLPTGKFRPNGEPILRPITLRYIILTKGCQAVKFTLSNITKYAGRGENKYPVFRSTTVCDHREESTGATGTTGVWGTREAQKTGRAKSYTPTGWVTEVSRMIGEDRAWELLREGGWDGTTTQI